MKMSLFDLQASHNENKQKKIYKSFFENTDTEYGAVGWLSHKRQEIRFSKLIEGTELSNKKILDFGCGTGAFYRFLKSENIECDYTGIDILGDYVAKAKHLHKGAIFKNISIRDESEIYDYVFASGVFAFSSPNVFFGYLEKAVSISKHGFIFNLILNAKYDGYLKLSKSALLSHLNSKYKYKTISGYLDSDITVSIVKD